MYVNPPVCGRCGNSTASDRWEFQWPNHGHIELGCCSQSFGKFRGDDAVAETEAWEFWRRGHPVLKRFDAQHVVMEWKGENVYDPKTGEQEYRLCPTCQHALFKVLGDFFHFFPLKQKS